jgi:hypothetical protein
LRGPGDELLGILDDLDRHFVKGLESLLSVGAEGFHPAFAVGGPALFIRFEAEPALVDDSEEDIAAVESVSAEHGAARDAAQTIELIQHKIPEPV